MNQLALPRVARAARLLALLLLLMALPVAAQSEDFTYTTNNGVITITGYTGPGGDVVIPSAITDLPVTCVGSNAFYTYNRHTVTSVTIPNSVTNIGSNAFFQCSSLTNVTVGSCVVRIG